MNNKKLLTLLLFLPVALPKLNEKKEVNIYFSGTFHVLLGILTFVS